MSFTCLNIALFLSFISFIFFTVTCFGGSQRTQVLQNASWMDVNAKSTNCEVDSRYGVQGLYVYLHLPGRANSKNFLAYADEAKTSCGADDDGCTNGTEADPYGRIAAAASCLNYADTVMGMCVLALICSLNTFVMLLLMRLSESIRRNTMNVKYISMFMSFLSALFISAALGFFYENCANATGVAQVKALKDQISTLCPGTKYTTTAGPGSVMAALGLVCMILLPFVLFPQASDPEPLAAKDTSKA